MPSFKIKAYYYKNSSMQIANHSRNLLDLTQSMYHSWLFHVHAFWIQLIYFIFFSGLGFLLLKLLPMRDFANRSSNLDLFFTSVSATTVSSMDSVPLESFSISQLIVITLLMLLGGEVFTSMLGLQFQNIRIKKELEIIAQKPQSLELTTSHDPTSDLQNQIEMGTADVKLFNIPQNPMSQNHIKQNSVRYLSFLVLGYLILVHFTGYTSILMYLNLFPSAKAILEEKGINLQTFSFFTVVSSFSNCGFIPTNENMIVFKACSGLLLMVSAQVLLGNTMFASTLRFVMWVFKKVTKRQEFEYMLRSHENIGYDHLLPASRALSVAVCMVGFMLIQLVLFCSMEWWSEGLEGLGSYQKLVAGLFMSVNSRHAGESVVDLSVVSPAVLVLYVVMMYLPPYTCFLPSEELHKIANGPHLETKKKRSVWRWQNVLLSQLSYLAIFVILVCITERRHLQEDPLNFNVLNIVIEVISAYGNVGYSTGYSCKRKLNNDGMCKDAWTGFSGRWSGEGKVVLMAVMFFGRLKKFSFDGGKAWKLA
ncbi:cation transporter HKT1;5-like [Carex rostrata]